MFNWLKKMIEPETAPAGPVTFDFEQEIAASPERIYGLLDFASDSCAKRELGHSVVETAPGTFCLTLWQMADTPFDLTIAAAEPHRHYAYHSEAQVKVGRLQWSRESYTIEPQQDGTSLVTLLVEAQFDEPMPMEEYSHHIAMMAMGCGIALEKLRLHAEDGVEAVMDFEAEQFA